MKREKKLLWAFDSLITNKRQIKTKKDFCCILHIQMYNIFLKKHGEQV